MLELKFDERKCSACETCDCLTRCQYMDIDKGTAKIEIMKIINGEDSFYCESRSGNFVTDLLKGSKDSPSRVRVREAYDTGADVFVVACPACKTMFSDAIKAEGLEEKLTVKDIAEIVKRTMFC